MLLGLPANDLPGIGFLHPIHLDLLDDHVVAPHRRDHFLGLEADFLEKTADGIGYQARVHDLAFHDGVGHERTHGDTANLGLVAGMIDDHDFHEAAADIQPYRLFAASEEAHSALISWGAGTYIYLKPRSGYH